MTRTLAYARLVRIPNVFTAFADIGIALAVGAPFAPALSWLGIFAASGCLYSAGMVWNDFFDRRIDAVERPSRPIPAGHVTSAAARSLAIGLSAIGLFFAFAAGEFSNSRSSIPLCHAAILLLLILGYDAKWKTRPMGCVAMGACRFMNVLLGFSILPIEAVNWPTRIATAGIVGGYITGVTYFGRDEATVSRKSTIAIGAIIAMTSATCAVIMPELGDGTARSLAVFLTAGLIAGLSLRFSAAFDHPTPIKVQRAIKAAIFGLVVLDAGLAVALAGFIGLTVLLFIAPAIVLGRWVYST